MANLLAIARIGGVSFRFAFHDDQDPPTARLWTDAAEVNSLSEHDREAIYAVIKEMENALARRDAERAYQSVRYAYEDMRWSMLDQLIASGCCA